MTKSVLAAPNSMCELRAIMLKTVITVVDILLVQYPKVQAGVYVVCCWLILFYSLDMVSAGQAAALLPLYLSVRQLHSRWQSCCSTTSASRGLGRQGGAPAMLVADRPPAMRCCRRRARRRPDQPPAALLPAGAQLHCLGQLPALWPERRPVLGLSAAVHPGVQHRRQAGPRVRPRQVVRGQPRRPPDPHHSALPLRCPCLLPGPAHSRAGSAGCWGLLGPRCMVQPARSLGSGHARVQAVGWLWARAPAAQRLPALGRHRGTGMDSALQLQLPAP
jgi:hypothetical protein